MSPTLSVVSRVCKHRRAAPEWSLPLEIWQLCCAAACNVGVCGKTIGNSTQANAGS